MLGWMHGEKVGERAELLVGESLGKAVHKANEVAREGAFVFVYCLTFGAVTIGEVAVVLAHRNHICAGIGAKNRVDLRCSRLKHFGIGQAPLAGMPGAALAIDK